MAQVYRSSRAHLSTLVLLPAALSLLAAVVVGYAGPGPFGSGFLAAALTGGVGAAALLTAWRSLEGDRRMAAWTIIAVLARVALAVALYGLLPRFGYPEQEQAQGYLFLDAYARDRAAWELAASGRSLWSAFGSEIAADQYGGLLAISAGLYRLFSPDAHRPLLVALLAAWMGALAVPFFYDAVRSRWGQAAAGAGAAVLALYPEAVLLGATQMREPFLITFSALGLWGVLAWRRSRWAAALALAGAAAGLLLFSSRAALPILGVLGVWFWLERMPEIRSPRLRWAGWAGFALASLAALALTGVWLQSAANWDAYLTLRASGMVQRWTEDLGEWALVPFVTLYGVVRPVLPAVVTDPDTVPLWRALWFARALGWYALAPLLAYATLRARSVQDAVQRRTLTLVSIAAWGWILLSAARAGGDQTDNPRYRVIFLAFLALLAGWGWVTARQRRDAWLGRWLAVEGIFLLLTTQWYASRYLGMLPHLPLWAVLALIALLSAGVFVGGWLYDRAAARREPPTEAV